MASHPDSIENLKKIPMLSLSDIEKEPTVLPLEEREIDDTKVLSVEINTNEYFNISIYILIVDRNFKLGK